MSLRRDIQDTHLQMTELTINLAHGRHVSDIRRDARLLEIFAASQLPQKKSFVAPKSLLKKTSGKRKAMDIALQQSTSHTLGSAERLVVPSDPYESLNDRHY